jgi:hypothetical protein
MHEPMKEGFRSRSMRRFSKNSRKFLKQFELVITDQMQQITDSQASHHSCRPYKTGMGEQRLFIGYSIKYSVRDSSVIERFVEQLT